MQVGVFFLCQGLTDSGTGKGIRMNTNLSQRYQQIARIFRLIHCMSNQVSGFSVNTICHLFGDELGSVCQRTIQRDCEFLVSIGIFQRDEMTYCLDRNGSMVLDALGSNSHGDAVRQEVEVMQ